ncbi:2861_t:CDS:2, partial [Ambispora leptoticha]
HPANRNIIHVQQQTTRDAQLLYFTKKCLEGDTDTSNKICKYIAIIQKIILRRKEEGKFVEDESYWSGPGDGVPSSRFEIRDLIVLGNFDYKNYIPMLTVTETKVEADNIIIIGVSHVAYSVKRKDL